MRRLLIIGIALLVACVCVGAVTASDDTVKVQKDSIVIGDQVIPAKLLGIYPEAISNYLNFRFESYTKNCDNAIEKPIKKSNSPASGTMMMTNDAFPPAIQENTIIINGKATKYNSLEEFTAAMKIYVKDWFENHRSTYRSQDFNTLTWSGAMLDSVITLICNNTNWTPDDRLELETYIMGWDMKLDEWFKYKDQFEMDMMEAEMKAREEGKEFDREEFKAQWVIENPPKGHALDDGKKYHDLYMDRYFKHYQVTGDYKRPNPAPF